MPNQKNFQDEFVVVTGAAGFIGSCLVGFLNRQGIENIIVVDEFTTEEKFPNLEGKSFRFKIERDQLFQWLNENNVRVSFFYHLGARTDTTEFDYSIHQRLNLDYSKDVWNYCIKRNINLVYASSAATYGDGDLGYEDDHEIPFRLKPLNPYGISKNEFDKWVLQQEKSPPHWYGLKFFNVYGPNEYHKGRMASVIFHSFKQIRENGFVKLFKSHRPDFQDGQQLRDFVYVKDVIKICYWFQRHLPASGLYNLGTGNARSFEHLVKATYAGINKETDIRYIDMPEDIRDKYQYFTEARMLKLEKAGYLHPFYTLEEGVRDYVSKYLANGSYY